MEFEVSISDEGATRFLEQLPQALQDEAEATLLFVLARLEKEVVEKTPRGVGGEAGLAGSWAGEVVRYGEGVMGVFGTPFEYAEPVELGRKPGKRPPTEPLVLWARRKLGLDERQAKRAAYVIARAIGKRGIEGHFMLRDSWTMLEPWIRDELEGIPDRAQRRVSGGAF